jgi:protocatechuate 3,4-dioxygenase beta subunit
MKTILSITLILLCLEIFSQEKKEIIIKTEVSEATVFINGAQVTRKKTIDLPAGNAVLKFSELSPYLDPQSVQVKINGEVIILSVNHQFNYLDSATRSKELENLNNKLKIIEDKLKIEKANLSIIDEDLTFLKENRNIGGKNQEVSLINLKETENFYKEKMTTLIMGELDINKKIEKLEAEKSNINDQFFQISTNEQLPISEVIVKIDAKTQQRCDIELSYYVINAGWYPSYDIRAYSIAKPIEIVYKANIFQNTKEEWKNIKLKLSSSNPNLGGVAPKLQIYYLNYYSINTSSYDNFAPKNSAGNASLKGTVFNHNTKESIPYANVILEKNGKLIAGASTDINGEFYIKSIIPGIYDLRATEINHNTVIITNIALYSDKITYQDINLQEKKTTLATVEIKSYKTPIIDKDQSLRGSIINENTDLQLPVSQTENKTSFEFDIKVPYTINSNKKITSVDMEVYNMNANYEYYCVPKLDKDVFLIANIADWEKYNLLEGEANIYFENTFVGKSILDVLSIADTLTISLGRDKNVMVKREKMKEYTTKQFLGSKKEETRAWKISVKNSKNLPINMTIFDQVPVSSLEEIEVSVENYSGALYNKENGEIKWKFNLEQSGKKDFDLKYKVKYPKDKILTID